MIPNGQWLQDRVDRVGMKLKMVVVLYMIHCYIYIFMIQPVHPWNKSPSGHMQSSNTPNAGLRQVSDTPEAITLPNSQLRPQDRCIEAKWAVWGGNLVRHRSSRSKPRRGVYRGQGRSSALSTCTDARE